MSSLLDVIDLSKTADETAITPPTGALLPPPAMERTITRGYDDFGDSPQVVELKRQLQSANDTIADLNQAIEGNHANSMRRAIIMKELMLRQVNTANAIEVTEDDKLRMEVAAVCYKHFASMTYATLITKVLSHFQKKEDQNVKVSAKDVLKTLRIRDITTEIYDELYNGNLVKLDIVCEDVLDKAFKFEEDDEIESPVMFRPDPNPELKQQPSSPVNEIVLSGRATTPVEQLKIQIPIPGAPRKKKRRFNDRLDEVDNTPIVIVNTEDENSQYYDTSPLELKRQVADVIPFSLFEERRNDDPKKKNMDEYPHAHGNCQIAKLMFDKKMIELVPQSMRVKLFSEYDFSDYNDFQSWVEAVDGRIVKLSVAILELMELKLTRSNNAKIYECVYRKYNNNLKELIAYKQVKKANMGKKFSSDYTGDGPKSTKGSRMKSKSGVLREEADLYFDLALARDAVKNSMRNIDDYNKKNSKKRNNNKKQRKKFKEKYKMTAHNRAHVTAQSMADVWFSATIPCHRHSLQWKEQKADEWDDYCYKNKEILKKYQSESDSILNGEQRLAALREMGVGCVGYDAPKINGFGKAYSSDYTGDGPKCMPTKSMKLRNGKEVAKGKCVKCAEYYGHPSFNGKCSICYHGRRARKIRHGKECLDLFANVQLIHQFHNAPSEIETGSTEDFIFSTIQVLGVQGKIWKKVIENKSYDITDVNSSGDKLNDFYKLLLNKINTAAGYKNSVSILKGFRKEGLKISAAMATRMMDEAFAGCTCRTYDQVTNFTTRTGEKKKIVIKNCGECKCATPVARHQFCSTVFPHIVDPWNLVLEQDYNKKNVSQVKRPPYVLCYYAH